MAYLGTDEEQIAQQQAASAAGGSGQPARTPTRSGQWVNLNKYMQGANTIIPAIGKDITTGIQGISGNLDKARNNVASASTYLSRLNAADFDNYSSVGGPPAAASNVNIQGVTQPIRDNISQLKTPEGQFDLLKNIQGSGITSGESKLNQFLLGKNTSGIQNLATEKENELKNFETQLGTAQTDRAKLDTDIASRLGTLREQADVINDPEGYMSRHNLNSNMMKDYYDPRITPEMKQQIINTFLGSGMSNKQLNYLLDWGKKNYVPKVQPWEI